MTSPLSFTSYKTGYGTLTPSMSAEQTSPLLSLTVEAPASPETVHPSERSLLKFTLMQDSPTSPHSPDSWLCHRVVNESEEEFDVEFMCHIGNHEWHKLLAALLMLDNVPPRFRKLSWQVHYNESAGIAAFAVNDIVLYVLTRPTFTPEGDEF